MTKRLMYVFANNFLIFILLGIHLELSDIFPIDPAEWPDSVLTLHGYPERDIIDLCEKYMYILLQY